MQSIIDTEKVNFVMTYLIRVVQDGLRSKQAKNNKRSTKTGLRTGYNSQKNYGTILACPTLQKMPQLYWTICR